MNILFLDAYFQPEQIAFTHLEDDLIQGLVDAGHTIRVVCPTPTRGVSDETAARYKSIKREEMYGGRVLVTRFSAPREGKNPLIRALRYFWCNLRTYQIGKKEKGIDAVFADSTPPTQGWIAGKTAKKLHAPFVYSLQDVFPDSLVTTGLTRERSLLWKIGRKMENAVYQSAGKIIVISEAMKKNLENKGVPGEKLALIPNWIDLEQIRPVAKEENPLFDEFGVDRSRFIVLYAGNFGAAQGAEIVLDAAERLLTEDGIRFVVFGGGPGFDAAADLARELPNVFIHPLLPQEKVSQVYSMGDAAVITCKKGVGNSGMPSKTWNILACGTPVIASFDQDSDLASILRDCQGGVTAEPENADALAKAILDVYGGACPCDPDKSRKYAEQHASKSACVEKYLEAFEEAAEKE